MWFLLADGVLYYFKQATDENPRCIITLENCMIEAVDRTGAKRCVRLFHARDGSHIKSVKRKRDGALVVGTRAEFLLRADSVEERDAWIKALRYELSEHAFNPFLDSLSRIQAE